LCPAAPTCFWDCPLHSISNQRRHTAGDICTAHGVSETAFACLG
jgi:hypothetical protein